MRSVDMLYEVYCIDKRGNRWENSIELRLYIDMQYENIDMQRNGRHNIDIFFCQFKTHNISKKTTVKGSYLCISTAACASFNRCAAAATST